MKISKAFPSDYLKAADLDGKAVRVTIDSVSIESMGDEEKAVLHFVGKDKGLVLNKTNANRIVDATGSDETEDWAGWGITLYSCKVDFQGRRVDAIRVDDRPGATKKPNGPAAAVRSMKNELPAEGYDSHPPELTDDDIKFLIMRYLCLDVEAVAIEGVETYLEPVSAPDNYKNPDAIAAYQAKARASQIDKAALDVDLARIVALGVRDDRGDIDVMRCVDETAEKFALTALWRWYHGLGTKFVTFNGLGYDLPLVLRRSLYLGIDAPQIQLDRFKHPQVIDLMAILSMDGKLKYHGLNFYAARFGLPLEPDIQGSDIGAVYAAGEWKAIERHCRNDVNTTWLLAQRIGVVPTAAELESAVL